MRRTFFFMATLFVGILVHIFADRFLTVFGIGPNVLLLFTVASGFLMGPLMGESLGFLWGLMADSLGVHFFGLQSLLLAAAGYISGKLSRRVASERPPAQLMIALVSSVLYVLTGTCVQHLVENALHRGLVVPLLLGTVLNVLVVTAAFYLCDRWIVAWKIEPEHQ